MTGRTVRLVCREWPWNNAADGGAVTALTAGVFSVITGVVTSSAMFEGSRCPAIRRMAYITLFRRVYMSWGQRHRGRTIARAVARITFTFRGRIMYPAAAFEACSGMARTAIQAGR